MAPLCVLRWRGHECRMRALRAVLLQADAELGAIWAVGQRIWQRDFPGIYTAVSAHQWSEAVQPIMEALRGACPVPAPGRALCGRRAAGIQLPSATPVLGGLPPAGGALPGLPLWGVLAYF